MIYSRFIFAIVFPIIITSCGDSSGGGNNSVRPEFQTSTPILAERQVENCTTFFSEQYPALLSVSSYINGIPNARVLDFSSQLVGNYVQSPEKSPIKETLYGYSIASETRYIYDDLEETYEIVHRAKSIVHNPGKRLDVCPSVKVYTGNSYENIGLNASDTITKTYAAITKFISPDRIGPITLLSSPTVMQRFIIEGGPQDTNETLYIADNAFYSPKEKIIAFLPHSKEMRHLFKAPFWEIPMVGSHEYGHHIFSTLMPKSSSRNNIIQGCFSSGLLKKHRHVRAEESSSRMADARFALRSINEGFADLIAFYSLDKASSSLKGINCFERNREPNTPHFARLLNAKFFTNKNIAILDSETVIEHEDACSSPDFQEIHDVGAAFAFGFDHMISKVIFDKETKLKVLLSWVIALNKEHEEIQYDHNRNPYQATPSIYIFNALELAYKIALEEARQSISYRHCRHLDNIFTDNHKIHCRFLN